MTKEEARIIILEHALRQAASMVSFLDGCLRKPKDYRYHHPEQTESHLQEWNELCPPLKFCPHSGFTEGCDGCVNGRELRKQLHEAEKVLEEKS